MSEQEQNKSRATLDATDIVQSNKEADNHLDKAAASSGTTLEDDPLSQENLRAGSSIIPQKGEPVLTDLPVRTPRNFEWVRTLPDSDTFHEILDPYDTTGGFKGTSYLLGPKLAAKVPHFVNYVRLYVTITRQGALFLWRIVECDSQGRRSQSAASQLEHAKVAQEKWIRIEWNGGSYQRFEAPGELSEPKWPSEPNTFMGYVRIAYKGRILLSLDDPVAQHIINKRIGME